MLGLVGVLIVVLCQSVFLLFHFDVFSFAAAIAEMSILIGHRSVLLGVGRALSELPTLAIQADTLRSPPNPILG